MYNRYIRNDSGSYTRIPEEERQSPPPSGPPPPPQSGSDGLSGFLRHFLDQFHLDHVDTGDLLLLGLLFFLFREDADEAAGGFRTAVDPIKKGGRQWPSAFSA